MADIKKLRNNYKDKYGFFDKIDYEVKLGKGLNEDVIKTISGLKKEPSWMLDIRLRAYKEFINRPTPMWGADLSGIDFDDIHYFVKAGRQKGHNWDEVPDKIKTTFEKLKVPQSERKFLAGTATQYESEVVYSRLKDEWAKLGVIFEDTDTGLKKYPELFKKYFGKVVPYKDNKLAALNTAVWSGGSFIYVPKGVKVDVPLQTYFRINLENMGQFERTLIIADEGSSLHYLEGCFTKGARVLTIDGEKNIENIEVGDQVLTHKGRYRNVYRIMQRKYSGDIYNIKIWGDSARELNVTDEHPLFVVKRKKSEYRNLEFKPEWIQAKDLKKSDYLMFPIRKNKNRLKKKATKVNIMTAGKFVHELDIDIPIEPDFFRLLGYFYAEGHVAKEHYISFTFNVKETIYLRDVKKLSLKYFGKKALANKPRLNGQTLVISSTKFARLFANEFGSTIKTKHIPEWIFSLPDECLENLIRGMWRGDGSYDFYKNSFRFSSISANLAYGYRNILLQLGIICGINRQKRMKPRHDLYSVNVSAQSNKKFGLIVDYDVYNGTKEGSPFYLDENYLYLPVKCITKKKEKTTVYNFSVEEDESYVAEGVISHNCTAPMYSTDSLHAAVVEIMVLKDAYVRYTTIQNWSDNVYNLVTKRAFAYENARMEWVDCNLGSKITMKYPSIHLRGEHAHGEVLSIAYADKGQVQDTGTKIIHHAPNTTSLVNSRSVCLNGGRTTYRGLLQATEKAEASRSKVTCDALIFDNKSRTDTYPTNKIEQKQFALEHEASVSRISQDQIDYLMSRGISEENAKSLILSGFLEPVAKELPMEYAVELNALLDMSMEGSVG